MKKVLLFAIMAAATGIASAQVKFGAKAGLNLSNVSVSPAESGVSYKMQPGFNAGLLANISLPGKFSLQPEVVYSGQGTKMKSPDGDGNIYTGYVNVPVLLKFKTAAGFFIEAGPQAGFLLSAKAKSSGVTTDIKDSFKSSDISGVFGLGYVSPLNIGVDARYNLGLSNLDKNSVSGSTAKNGVIQIGVFYFFGGK